jgi:hypothetical protein
MFSLTTERGRLQDSGQDSFLYFVREKKNKIVCDKSPIIGENPDTTSERSIAI